MKKFRSRETAISRIWTAIQGLGATLPAPAPAVQPEKAGATKKATPKGEPAVAREGSWKAIVIGLLEKPV